jgi:co-chaperonin GroES (HSP10)
MNIEMLNGNILTELQQEEKTSGLYIPDAKSYKIVKVVKTEGEIKKDSLLYVLKSAGTSIEMDTDKYVVVNIREIILIV